jgi:hypothetical protein
VSIGYLADTGSWSESMAECLTDVDALGVEFNHDVAMQESSGRPWFLIKRNLGDNGHLSNRQGAELVSAVLARSRRGALRHLVLLHLSQQCNQPELAVETARAALQGSGRRIVVQAARQSPAHPNLWIAPSRKPALAASPRPRPGALRPPSVPSRPADHGGAQGLSGLFRADLDQDGPTAGTL